MGLHVVLLACFLFLRGALAGELVCEELPVGMCSYSIATSGKRCVVETDSSGDDGIVNLQCKTSEVVVSHMNEHIETEQCTSACGLDRISIGISSDSLADPKAVHKLCSANCYQNCPNIIDLFTNLALAEGASLRDRCKKYEKKEEKKQKTKLHTTQLLNTGAALGPVSVADPPVSTTGPPITVADGPVAAADPPESVTVPPITVADGPVAAADPPESVTVPPITVADGPESAAAPVQF